MDVFFGFLLLLACWAFTSRRVILESPAKRVFAATPSLIYYGESFLHVTVLCYAIYLSGGFLDSPFSGTLGMHLGFFILFQRRYGTLVIARRLNIFLGIWTLVLCGAPYVIANFHSNSFEFSTWSSNGLVVTFRIVLSFALMYATAWTAITIENRLERR